MSRSTAPPHALQIDGAPKAVLPPAGVDRTAVIAETRDWIDWCLGAGTAERVTLLDALTWVMCADHAPLELRLEAAAVMLPRTLGGAGFAQRGTPHRH